MFARGGSHGEAQGRTMIDAVYIYVHVYIGMPVQLRFLLFHDCGDVEMNTSRGISMCAQESRRQCSPIADILAYLSPPTVLHLAIQGEVERLCAVKPYVEPGEIASEIGNNKLVYGTKIKTRVISRKWRATARQSCTLVLRQSDRPRVRFGEYRRRREKGLVLHKLGALACLLRRRTVLRDAIRFASCHHLMTRLTPHGLLEGVGTDARNSAPQWT